MEELKLLNGDNIELLKTLPENSIDSVVTDPPYGLSFMNKKWDHQVPSVEFWKEVYRVLKPGGHVLSFGGTRTYHRMTVNIEDAGFEIRDQIMWLYGSGFPKSHNIGKSVDKIKGNKREVIGERSGAMNNSETSEAASFVKDGVGFKTHFTETKGTSEWEGWGTALKPANEPICVARKPLSEKTIADNVLKWGTGGINIDGCRVGSDSIKTTTNKGPGDNGIYGNYNGMESDSDEREGRFPANIILDEEAGQVLDEQSGISKSSSNKWEGENNAEVYGKYQKGIRQSTFSDKGGASRFFYQAKVSKKERNMGLDAFEEKETKVTNFHDFERLDGTYKSTPVQKNTHPTVKPVALMAYLCRLVTPPNGICLDPFMGSGSTGIAARLEGFRFCGMEMDDDYFKIASSRIENFESYREFIKK
jgi:site-specific DNA-methyltransferase (adenine-specific)